MGVVVIPLSKAKEIVKSALELAAGEEETRKWVSQGKTIEDLLEKFGRI
jgi:4-hydroxy-4-methyl-2-oxoglutarate aldolase